MVKKKQNNFIFSAFDTFPLAIRDADLKAKIRAQRTKDYFYGVSQTLCPHSVVYNLSEIKIVKAYLRPAPPSNTLPIGANTTSFSPLRVKEVSLDKENETIVILAVSQIERDLENNDIPDDVAWQPVFGFIAM